MTRITDGIFDAAYSNVGDSETEEPLRARASPGAPDIYAGGGPSASPVDAEEPPPVTNPDEDAPRGSPSAPAAPVGGQPRPALPEDIQQMRDSGGFTAGQINRFIDLQRPYWRAAGLTDEQIDKYYGVQPFNVADISDFFKSSARELWGYGRTDVPSLNQYLTAGLRTSDAELIRLLWLHQHPQEIVTPEDSPIFQRIVQGVGQMAGDAPVMMMGYFAGGGLFNPVLGAGGAMALSAGLRVALLNAYNGGQINKFDDFLALAEAVGIETLRGEITGVATAGIASPLAKIAAGEASVANATANSLLNSSITRSAARTMEGPAAFGMQALADLDFRDKFDAQDLIDNSLMLLGIHLATRGQGNLAVFGRKGLRGKLREVEAVTPVPSAPSLDNLRSVEQPDILAEEVPAKEVSFKDEKSEIQDIAVTKDQSTERSGEAAATAQAKEPTGETMPLPLQEHVAIEQPSLNAAVTDWNTSDSTSAGASPSFRDLHATGEFRRVAPAVSQQARLTSAPELGQLQAGTDPIDRGVGSGSDSAVTRITPFMSLQATGAFLRAAQHKLGELYVKYGIPPSKGVKILASRTEEFTNAARSAGLAEAPLPAEGLSTDISDAALSRKSARDGVNEIIPHFDDFQSAAKYRRRISRDESSSDERPEKTYQTYTKTHHDGKTVYVGRTSGTGSPEENVLRRDARHHMNEKGFGPAVLHRTWTTLSSSIGGEQLLMELHGGARSETSGNRINGISRDNPKRQRYLLDALVEYPLREKFPARRRVTVKKAFQSKEESPTERDLRTKEETSEKRNSEFRP